MIHMTPFVFYAFGAWSAFVTLWIVACGVGFTLKQIRRGCRPLLSQCPICEHYFTLEEAEEANVFGAWFAICPECWESTTRAGHDGSWVEKKRFKRPAAKGRMPWGVGLMAGERN